MRYLLIVLMLSGCSTEAIQAVGSGLQTAGGGLSPDVYNAQREIYAAQKRVDQVCMQRCFKEGYTWQYCEHICEY